MLVIVLTLALNVALYFGMIKGVDNALNIAVFVMYAMALMNAMAMFMSDHDLLTAPETNFLYRWFLRTLIVCTVFHSIYWGYFFAPAVWLFAVVVVWLRKYHLDNKKRF